jgi:hypothetical protein
VGRAEGGGACLHLARRALLLQMLRTFCGAYYTFVRGRSAQEKNTQKNQKKGKPKKIHPTVPPTSQSVEVV